MSAASNQSDRFRPQALAGGFEFDPDLDPPEPDPYGVFGGLHVLRHLGRFLDSLGMELVITGDCESSELLFQLGGDYEPEVADSELQRYRFAEQPQDVRDLLHDEPRAVPLFGMSGSSCLGWTEVTWEGVRLDRHLQPGRLIAFTSMMAQQIPSRDGPGQLLHLLAWQAPFPTHSLVTWGNEATLLDGPQPLDESERMAAGHMFHTGQAHCWSSNYSADLAAFWAGASAVTLAAPPED